MQVFKFFFAATLCMALLNSCYYDNEDDLYGLRDSLIGCDTAIVSYASTIRPIIDARCIDCHGSNPSGGAAKLNSYNLLKIYLDGNKKRFIESINQTGSALPMPEGKMKIPACELHQITIWINNGYPNN